MATNNYTTFGSFDRIQTFNVSKDAAHGAASVMITSIDLFFKVKPDRNFKTSLGTTSPSIKIALCEVKNDIPDLNSVISTSIKIVDYNSVNVGGVATNVAFDQPIMVSSDTYYGIIVDAGGYYVDASSTDTAGNGFYSLYENVKGQNLYQDGTMSNIVSSGPKSGFKGSLYGYHTNSFTTPYYSRAIKFSVYIAKYNSGSDGTVSSGQSSSITVPAGTLINASFDLVNKPYEFLTITGNSGTFRGGEWVYKDVANDSGTISLVQGSDTIVGVGTNFSNNHLGLNIVANNFGEDKVFTITQVVNTSVMLMDYGAPITASGITYKIPPMGAVYYQSNIDKLLVLDESNAANSAFKFSDGDLIRGHLSKTVATVSSVSKYSLDAFTTNFGISQPSTSNVKIKYALTKADNTIADESEMSNNSKVNIPYDGYVLSRSLEVMQSGLYSTDKKSAHANVTFNITSGGANTYIVPFINSSTLNFEMEQNDINNTTLATRNGIAEYDTEVDKNGIGISKYISEKISFNEDRFAEDVLAYVTAFRPAGTEIKVYAKIHNSADREAFDDKGWTPLVMRSNNDKYSGEDSKNLVEYSFGLPSFPEVDKRLSGAFFSVNGSDTISTTVDQQTQIAAGDLIKLTSPLFEKNNEVFAVKNVSGANITLTRPVTNVNVVGEVRVEKLKYKKTAWNNAGNYGISRYVNEAGVEFDYYNTLQIKVVLLAEKSWITPRVEQLQVIGASV